MATHMYEKVYPRYLIVERVGGVGGTLPELEIAVGHWSFSDHFSPFGQANPIC